MNARARRALLLASARPSASGDAAWRRFRMLAAFLRDVGPPPDVLWIGDGLAREEASLLRGEGRLAGVAPAHAAQAAAAHLAARRAYDLVMIADPGLGAAAPEGLFRLADLPDADAPPPRADLVLVSDPRGRKAAEEAGLTAMEAPYLGVLGRRKTRPATPRERLLAGVWVEDEAASIEAAAALFDKIAARGGGGAPNFALAGPGGAALTPPPLPFPVTRMAPELEETVFYRGVDLAVAPDLGASRPRLDIVSALEHGAAPLASSSALTGLRSRWRLPHFGELDELADFLFERGAEMRDGRLLAELRARADWTWNGLAAAAARQRARLIEALREARETR